MSTTINEHYAQLRAKENGNSSASSKTRKDKLFSQAVVSNIRRYRTDILDWRTALKASENVDNPNPVRLFDIYHDVLIDALFTSQLENRMLMVTGADFELQNEADEPDLESTKKLSGAMFFPDLQERLHETIWWHHSLFELGMEKGEVNVELIPRKHVRPKKGIFLKRQYDTEGIAYRQMKEYGSWLIEAKRGSYPGLLNKAVPHILIKRFAQSCWSEFCEIYGMPIRTLKTNTSDPEMLAQAEKMMASLGSNPWAIIDESETMEYAEQVGSNGEVYKALIALCNSELSLLASGAIIGQDTEHGNYSKDKVGSGVLENRVFADMTWIENVWTSTILPALYRIGFLPPGLKFRYKIVEDLDGLWKKTYEASQHYNVDGAWIYDKFGIPVTPKSFGDASLSLKKDTDPDFFG